MAHSRSVVLHNQQEVAIFISRSCDPPRTDPADFCACALMHNLRQMASSAHETPKEITKLQAACEYQALKECLERNNWKKARCEKEWLEFETLCSRNRQ